MVLKKKKAFPRLFNNILLINMLSQTHSKYLIFRTGDLNRADFYGSKGTVMQLLHTILGLPSEGPEQQLAVRKKI